ncbi:MAG: hypothetical protein ACM3N4_11510 [Nitrososphaerota archaeon]
MASDSGIAPTWGAQLARATQLLAEAGSPAPEQEAAELLSHLLGVPVALLMAQPGVAMRQNDVQMYASWVGRRAGGLPIPYITGHLEFMGLDITVGWDSPLPPPGAPQVVDAALQWARSRASGDLSVAEMDTGCGAIALALAALEPRFTRIYALDASPETLSKARVNGERYLLNLVINWLDGRDLDAIPEPVDLIICGQPCLPSPSGSGVERPEASGALKDARLREIVGHMPLRSARLLTQAPEKLRPGGALICIVAETERASVTTLLQNWPTAPAWADAQSDGIAIAVAQLSQNTDDDTLSSGLKGE